MDYGRTGDSGDATGDATGDAGNFLSRKFPEPFKELASGV